jgi:hypothetical protein
MALAQILNQAQTRWYTPVVATAKRYYTGGISAAKHFLRGMGF